MPALKITRDEALLRIAEVFRRHGYDGATLGQISDITGLGKASLYHHFPGGKAEMARAVLGRVGAAIETELTEPLRGDGSPRERLAAFTKGIEQLYEGGKKSCILGAMVLGGSSKLFAGELGHAFGTLIGAVTSFLVEVGVARGEARRRAEDAVARIQGSLILARGVGDEKLFRRMLKDLPEDLLRSAR